MIKFVVTPETPAVNAALPAQDLPTDSINSAQYSGSALRTVDAFWTVQRADTGTMVKYGFRTIWHIPAGADVGISAARRTHPPYAVARYRRDPGISLIS